MYSDHYHEINPGRVKHYSNVKRVLNQSKEVYSVLVFRQFLVPGQILLVDLHMHDNTIDPQCNTGVK